MFAHQHPPGKWGLCCTQNKLCSKPVVKGHVYIPDILKRNKALLMYFITLFVRKYINATIQ